jgi:hypothetical protein
MELTVPLLVGIAILIAQKYLGVSAPECDSLRVSYSGQDPGPSTGTELNPKQGRFSNFPSVRIPVKLSAL